MIVYVAIDDVLHVTLLIRSLYVSNSLSYSVTSILI